MKLGVPHSKMEIADRPKLANNNASRYITGAMVFYQDNFNSLLQVMKSAVSKYGVPKIWNFDNGGSFKNRQMELLAARTGSTVHYCHPYTPTQKSKIERW